MRIFKEDTDKEFVCKECNTFLDQNELEDGNCPNCESDDNVFHNDDEYKNQD